MTATDLFLRRGLSSRILLCAIALSLPTALIAADSHGHDHGPASGAATEAASPRFEAHSDLFEMVGVVDNGRMTVYLDRYASNEPVTAAKIDYESGAQKGTAQPQPDGTYLIQFDALGKPGQLPLSFTVTAGSDTDLLAGELTLQDPHQHHAAQARPWQRWVGLAAAGLAALFAVVGIRRHRAARAGRFA